MKKIFAITIKWDKSPKCIWVNDMYLNSKWKSSKWRTLAPWARSYKNYLRQEFNQKVIREKFEQVDDTVRIFYEIDLKYWLYSENKWVITKRINKIKNKLSIRDADWLIKLPQDVMSWIIYKDDDQVLTFDPAPIEFFIWEWFELKIVVYEWNEDDYWRWRKARHEFNW